MRNRAAVDGWRWSESAKGGYACTFTSPKWPHEGKFGEALYVKVTAARGWFVLRSGCGTNSASWLEDSSFAAALELLPAALRSEGERAHGEALAAAKAAAMKWQSRWVRLRAERAEAGL